MTISTTMNAHFDYPDDPIDVPAGDDFWKPVEVPRFTSDPPCRTTSNLSSAAGVAKSDVRPLLTSAAKATPSKELAGVVDFYRRLLPANSVMCALGYYGLNEAIENIGLSHPQVAKPTDEQIRQNFLLYGEMIPPLCKLINNANITLMQFEHYGLVEIINDFNDHVIAWISTMKGG